MYSNKTVGLCMEGITYAIQLQKCIARKIIKQQAAQNCVSSVIAFIRQAEQELALTQTDKRRLVVHNHRQYCRQIERLKDNQRQYRICKGSRIQLIQKVLLGLKFSKTPRQVNILTAEIIVLYSLLKQFEERIDRSNLLQIQKQADLKQQILQLGKQLSKTFARQTYGKQILDCLIAQFQNLTRQQICDAGSPAESASQPVLAETVSPNYSSVSQDMQLPKEFSQPCLTTRNDRIIRSASKPKTRVVLCIKRKIRPKAKSPKLKKTLLRKTIRPSHIQVCYGLFQVDRKNSDPKWRTLQASYIRSKSAFGN